MYLIEVIPLTKIPIQKPQIFSYFSARQIEAGSLVLVPLSSRQEKALVLESHKILDRKMELKQAEFELKPILKIISPYPVLTLQQIKLGLWLGQYYFASPGMFFKMMLPKKVTSYKLQVTSYNQQKLILVPTVAQIYALAKNYPKNKTAIIHSGLKSKEFQKNWQKIANNKTEIIIGTRLALFAPFANLKQIKIKDETNSGHRSFDMFPHYRAHEVAQKLAQIFKAEIVFESDLPSPETFFYKARLHQTTPDSVKLSKTPRAEIIDLRQELREGNFSIFSRHLQELISRVLEKKGQVILFINRRGTGTFVLCRDCGFVEQCQNCASPMTFHLLKSGTALKPALICHHCGKQTEPPTLCPKCQSHRIKAFGSGTQRVETEAEKLFKGARIARLDSDNVKTQPEINKIIERFKEKNIDILIGTQMLLNSVGLRAEVIAIISADTLMHLPDFRSNERTFQTIIRLAEYADSHFIIQTYNPQQNTIRLAAEQNFKEFYGQEIATRHELNYPPFSQLVKLVFRHKNPTKAATESKILHAKLTQQTKNSKILKEVIIEIIGPIPAFISKEKGKYIWQIILKATPYWIAQESERENILQLRNKILMTVPPGWEIDIDPETLL